MLKIILQQNQSNHNLKRIMPISIAKEITGIFVGDEFTDLDKQNPVYGSENSQGLEDNLEESESDPKESEVNPEELEHERLLSVPEGEKTALVELDTNAKISETLETDKSEAPPQVFLEENEIEQVHVKKGSEATQPSIQELGEKDSEPARSAGDEAAAVEQQEKPSCTPGDETSRECKKDSELSNSAKDTLSAVPKTDSDTSAKSESGEIHAQAQDNSEEKKNNCLDENTSSLSIHSSSDEDSHSAFQRSSSRESDGSIQETRDEEHSNVLLQHSTLGQRKLGFKVKTIREKKRRRNNFKHMVTHVEEGNFASTIGLRSSTVRDVEYIIAISNVPTDFMHHHLLLAHMEALDIEKPIRVTLRRCRYTDDDEEPTEECIDLAFKFHINKGELELDVLLHPTPCSWKKDLIVIRWNGRAGTEQQCFIQHEATGSYLKVDDGRLRMASLQEAEERQYKFTATIFHGLETTRKNKPMFVFAFSPNSEVKHYVALLRQDQSQVGLLKLPSIDMEKVKKLETQIDHRYFYNQRQQDQSHIFESSVYPKHYLAVEQTETGSLKLFFKYINGITKSSVVTDPNVRFILQIPETNALI